MADSDARNGVRALINGGVFSIESDKLDALSKYVAIAQRERGETPNIPEVEYLQEYASICEKRISGVSEEDEAQTQLESLNARFPNLSESLRRTQLPSAEEEDEGWENSQAWYSSAGDCW